MLHSNNKCVNNNKLSKIVITVKKVIEKGGQSKQ